MTGAGAAALVGSALAMTGMGAAGAATQPAWLQAKQAALASFRPPPPASVVATPGPSASYYTSELITATVRNLGPAHTATCTIKGELLTPTGVNAAHPAPAVVTTNGFGGSYDDSTTLGSAQNAAYDGYVALTYSGLGFGGSSCAIELDSPAWDGAAASQLISWLGTLPQVTKDDPSKDDPRVGMIGGSYGGSIQFATASIDPRVDALVPIITWNDLAYSLAPNNATDGTTTTSRTDAEPGALKYQWTGLFFGDGIVSSAKYAMLAQQLATGCPGFDPAICSAFARTVAAGYPDPTTTALLHGDSMVSYYRTVHIPVLLAQGEDDSLFNIQEAVRNLRELQANGDPAQLVLQSWGHSSLTPAPGELTYAPPFDGYENVLIKHFYDRWLRATPGVSTGPAVQYFRPWVSYTGSAAAAYGTAPSWPVGTSRSLYLSGGSPAAAGALVPSSEAVVAGSQTFLNTGPTGTSYSETSAVQDTQPFSSIPPSDTPGTFAAYSSAPLPSPVDVVGIPKLTVRLTSSVGTGTPTSPATDPVVYAKLYDVAPDGTRTLADRLVAPVRVTDTSRPVTITLPGVSAQYAAGHRIELVIASGDDAYFGNRTPEAYTVSVAPGTPGSLTLPVVPQSAQRSGGEPVSAP
ncbi:CocE/NonD family hydrolase [Acidiferrimicrobium sp. IK]|uniref:CocE/NonD family hydrolase n=1 Tax=Acidiferrimicrobium sp. IK TaxID=2871700 RepID=UPI0021CB5FD7|nr:CocE/NonD family hydrolase [Acidiferrimicrobium sp. IK]MCU4182741.1 CocE/NonD family hydrolase [Acidiferrimicrobium sp. IK]